MLNSGANVQDLKNSEAKKVGPVENRGRSRPSMFSRTVSQLKDYLARSGQAARPALKTPVSHVRFWIIPSYPDCTSLYRRGR